MSVDSKYTIFLTIKVFEVPYFQGEIILAKRKERKMMNRKKDSVKKITIVKKYKQNVDEKKNIQDTE